MNEKEIMAKKNESKKRWSNIKESTFDLLIRAKAPCGYCNIFEDLCSECPLDGKICSSDNSLHGKAVSALKTAYENALALRDAIAKDIEESKLKGS